MRHAEDPCPLVCHGQWHGSIAEQPQGNHGFGYDPIFWLADQQCTAAQLAPAQKRLLSHRGKALQQLVSQLLQEL
jgi:XTP/dITP diphosphohydrolase